ncbi:hypothetical protein Lepto7375DRAFT_0977 [Leptolyngbya sp. PCC 7375]|nr:hypothetical protein Lepto7375DRAFT_0977 [Leptolyngbya sp. PCC 7375]
MQINQTPPMGEVTAIAIGYSSPDSGTFELTMDASVFNGGFELTYVIATIYLRVI